MTTVHKLHGLDGGPLDGVELHGMPGQVAVVVIAYVTDAGETSFAVDITDGVEIPMALAIVHEAADAVARRQHASADVAAARREIRALSDPRRPLDWSRGLS